MSTEVAKPKGRKRKLVVKALLLINLAAIFLLLVSYLSAFISPEHIWWMELFALAYGILLSINVFFTGLWLILRKRYFMYSLIAILIGITRVLGIVQFGSGDHSTKGKAESGEHLQLKVISYNVHLFDLYNWYKDHKMRPKIFNLLSKESPDIACFQEFFSSTRKDYEFENAERLKKIMSTPYAHIAYTLTLRETDHWGIATYSKYPIFNQQTVLFDSSKGNIFIYSDIAAGIDTFRVFNVHLESDRFLPADYRFVQNLDIGKNEESKLEGYRKRIVSILYRLKKAAIKRAKQAPIMARYIAESPYPVIVCGDFNDTPSSFTYRTLRKGLTDAFRESGSGFGKTYLGAFPSYRIDYILHDKKMESTSFRTGNQDFSDHYPVSCVVQKKN